MSVETTVEGLVGIRRAIYELRGRYARTRGVKVGFRAAYALYVHENVEMKLQGKPRPSGIGVYWGPRGQAKFLEGPAREMRNELAATVRRTAQRTKSMDKALMAGGLKLQRASQKRVPVEYGDLKRSAFTELTDI